MTCVLEAAAPAFTTEQAARIAAELFDIHGGATDLGSERDQTFLIDDGGAGGILKISNSAEDPAVLDLEAAAIAHVAAVDPELPVARPRARARYEGHHVRLFERLHGRKGGPELPDAAVRAYGETHARLNVALRSFFHPAAGRELLWDMRQTPRLRGLLDAIGDAGRRALVERTVARFERRVLPRWPLLRGQVVHGDLNLDNVLLEEDGRIAGIVDFGDCSFSAQAADLAVGVASLLRGRPAEDVFRIARLALDGYQSQLPLEPLELELLGDLVAARFAAIVAISAWRTHRYPENADYIRAWDAESWPLLALLDELGPERVAAELGAEPPRVPGEELARRRQRATGGILTRLAYARPVHVVRGEGVWLFEADGSRLLDAYNNVPVVGHCHPRVTEAVVRQTRLLNTHARYLYEPLVELAERLLATMPSAARLDTVVLVSSGSEANDLAWRLATGVTSRTGAIVTEHAYHGVTAAASELSPEEWPPRVAPPQVERIPPPLPGRRFGEALETALERLGGGLAATFLDGALMSDGIHEPGADELRLLVERTHAAGGLYVADEVQAGHGRTGPDLWSFARQGIEPDVVTLGKAMGNGYPVAALVTRGELAERFPYAGRTFSTFGGNPVAARAALAVLEVLADEKLPGRAAAVGERLREAIRGLTSEEILEVRGSGLLAGVQLREADAARRAVDELREHGVLAGRTGPREDVLKIRPPLVFGAEHAQLFVEALAATLDV